MTALVALALVTSSSVADFQYPDEAARSFGLGAQVGYGNSSAGLLAIEVTGKYWVTESNALQFGVMFRGSSTPATFSGPVARADWVYELWTNDLDAPVRLGLIAGGGVGVTMFGDSDSCYLQKIGGRVCFGTDSTYVAILARVPVAFTAYFHAARLETFFEVAPTLEVNPPVGLWVFGNLGARYYF